jgi:hypothetical protein
MNCSYLKQKELRTKIFSPILTRRELEDEKMIDQTKLNILNR